MVNADVRVDLRDLILPFFLARIFAEDVHIEEIIFRMNTLKKSFYLEWVFMCKYAVSDFQVYHSEIGQNY